MEKLRLGIVGLGSASKAHLEAYRTVEEIVVAAAAELREDRLHKMAGQYRFQPYTDYRSMLQQIDLDLVCVLTPVATHREVTESIASHGLHVFCEKPLAVNLEDAERMVSTCSDHGIKLFYGASYRFLPALRGARDLIRSGTLGDIVLLTESMVGGSGPESHKPMGFAHYPKGGPGGSGMGLFDHGIHLVDTFAWLMDSEIVSVLGRGNISGAQPATEYMHMNFANGAVGQLLYNDNTFSADLPGEGQFSWGSAWEIDGSYVPPGAWHEHPGCIRVHGTRGALRIFHYANLLFRISPDGTEQLRVPDRPPPGHFGLQIESFIRSIRRDEEPEVTGRDGINALRAILAAYESFERQETVFLKPPKR